MKHRAIFSPVGEKMAEGQMRGPWWIDGPEEQWKAQRKNLTLTLSPKKRRGDNRSKCSFCGQKWRCPIEVRG